MGFARNMQKFNSCFDVLASQAANCSSNVLREVNVVMATIVSVRLSVGPVADLWKNG